MDPKKEAELAASVGAILSRFEATPIFKRLRVRLRELGDDHRDEVLHFKQLQRACRESPELLKAFADGGFGDLTKLDARAPDPVTGSMIQAFNRFVEAHWRG